MNKSRLITFNELKQLSVLDLLYYLIRNMSILKYDIIQYEYIENELNKYQFQIKHLI